MPRLPSLVLPGLLLLASAPVPQQAPGTCDLPRSLVVLRAYDEATAAFDLDTGEHTGRLVGGELLLDRAELVYGLFEPGALSFGFRLKEQALLVDLGDTRLPPVTTTADLLPKPAVSVFSTLELQGGRFFVVEPPGRRLRFKEAERVLLQFPDDAPQHVVPEVGHVYVLRWRDPTEPHPVDEFAKLRVVDHVPGRSVTLAWERLAL